MKPPQLFQPEMFTNDCLPVVKDHGEGGEVFLGEGCSGHDALTILVSYRAQAIFEKFWVENNCDICHFKSEMKRVDSQKKKNEDDGA